VEDVIYEIARDALTPSPCFSAGIPSGVASAGRFVRMIPTGWVFSPLPLPL